MIILLWFQPLHRNLLSVYKLHSLIAFSSVGHSLEGRSRKEIMERLLTLQEVCQMLGSTDPKGRMVRNLRSQGKLEAAKFGRQLLFKESSVKEYIEKQFKIQKKVTHKGNQEM